MTKIRLTLLSFLLPVALSAQTLTLPALRDSIAKILEKDHLPGLMLALVHRDSVIWAGGIGLADRDSNRPVTEHDLFRIGSISKTFTSLAIQRLVREGKLSLSDKLHDIAPEIPFVNAWEETAPVRVVHLLEHTAGFDDMHFKDMINLSGEKKSALDEVKAHQAAMVSRWQPGTRMSYSNPGYAALGFIIEKYSGKTYSEYISETVFQPLKMNETTFSYERKAPYATGYSYDGSYHIADPVIINGGAAGAISSSSSDMAKFVRMLLNNGTLDSAVVVPEATLRDMERTHSTWAADAGLINGYGYALYSKMHGNEDNMKWFHGHNGGIMGFSSDMAYATERGVGFALSNNGEGSNRKISNLVAEFLFQNEVAPLPAVQPLDLKSIEPWLGTYIDRSPRNAIIDFMNDMMGTMKVFVRNDTLYTQPFLGEAEPRLHIGNKQFVGKGQPVASMMLMEVGGNPVMYADGSHAEKIEPFKYYVNLIFNFLAILLGTLSIILAMIWLILTFMKRMAASELWQRATPALAFGSFIAMIVTSVFMLDLKNLYHSASINAWTLTIFAGSILFPVLSFLALYYAWSNRAGRGPLVRYFMLITAFSLCYFAVYLGTYGWIGMRMWAF